jgi:hypothetical protein
MPGMTSRLGTALQTPSSSMSWVQLAAATIFVVVVLVAWRQVVRYILRET